MLKIMLFITSMLERTSQVTLLELANVVSLYPHHGLDAKYTSFAWLDIPPRVPENESTNMNKHGY